MNDGAMMTDDDVLRLAAQVLGNPLLFEDLKQDFTVHTEAGDWIKFARALLSASKPAALHQPTEAMLNAARDWSLKKYGLGIGSDAAIGCWQAMLAAAPAQSGEAVEADVVPNEIAELLTEPCWNLSRRDVSDLLKRIGSILYTAPQSSQPSAVVLDDERAAFEEFRASLVRLNDANTPVSIADRVMILSNATFLLDEYARAASPQANEQMNQASK
jgi:hypothetical protein